MTDTAVVLIFWGAAIFFSMIFYVFALSGRGKDDEK